MVRLYKASTCMPAYPGYSAYMGHVDIIGTQETYLNTTPELSWIWPANRLRRRYKKTACWRTAVYEPLQV